ncbi:MAG: sulfotransferase domain-containing protein [Ignavibacteriae bacterium]|nr:sulfotransferase domain-containing protein [Ignavibacteriota bacterium]
MFRKKENKILVTGLVRFGTSWIGNMLSLGNNTVQIFEPFSIWHPKYYGNLKIRYHFAYEILTNPNFQNYIRNIEKARFNLLSEFKQIDSIRTVGKFFVRTIPFNFKAKISKNLIIKDPFAFFMSEYFSKNLNYKVVLIMRHPCSFVDSMLRFNGKWDRHNFCYSILSQKDLMQKFNLSEFVNPLEKFSKMEKEREKSKSLKFDNEMFRLERACLIWKIYTRFYIELINKNIENIIPIYYEDFANTPIENFSKLYQKLDLNFSKKIEDLIFKNSNFSKVTSKKIVDTKRNSKTLASIWKKNLSKNQIDYIFTYCSNELKVLKKYFDDEY